MGGSNSRNKRRTNQNKEYLDKDSHSTVRDKRSVKKRHFRQLAHDRKHQRLSKEQLTRLSKTLHHTPWYLGRRLGLTETTVNRVTNTHVTDYDQNHAILLMWRKRQKYGATAQNLVIVLELAGYEYEEYKCILTPCGDDGTGIYEKAPSLKTSDAMQNDMSVYKSIKVSQLMIAQPDQVYDNVLPNDIIKFTKKNWKQPKPARKKYEVATSTDDSGIATSPDQSCVYSERFYSNYPENKNSHVTTNRRYSDSTMDDTTSSLRHGSDDEINRIFEFDKKCPIIETNEYHGKHFDEDIGNLNEKKLLPLGDAEYFYEENLRGSSIKSYSLLKFGGRGNFPSRFKGLISGIDVTSANDIVVSDSDNMRIQIFDQYGNFKDAFDTQSDLKPKGLFVTKSNHVLVCCGKEVRVFTIEGALKTTFGQGTFRNNCYSVCADVIGTHYVTDIVGHTVSMYDNRGNIRKRFGYQGKNLMNFDQPVALVISDNKELLISDSQNHCVKVYSLAGRPLHAIGNKGTNDGEFWNPFGMCFDNNGYLYVADCGNDRISMFDHTYTFVRHVLTELDGLEMPSFIRINSLGQLIVSEWNKQQIKVFSFGTAV